MQMQGDPTMTKWKPLDPRTRCIRKCKHSDYDSVCELSKSIWEGQDYLPFVFHEWVDDNGLFLCIEDTEKNRIIATDKYTILPDRAGLLEGLRVHKDYRGQSLSWHIGKAAFEKALQDKQGGTTNRIVNCTHITNKASIHMSTSIGFKLEQKYLVVETSKKETPIQFTTQKWEPTFEEFRALPYFKHTDGYIAQHFLVQKVTPALFETLQKSAHFFILNGSPGFFDHSHGWYNIALDPTSKSILDWLHFANEQPQVTDCYSFIHPNPSILKELQNQNASTWMEFEPDLLYYVYGSDEAPSVLISN